MAFGDVIQAHLFKLKIFELYPTLLDFAIAMRMCILSLVVSDCRRDAVSDNLVQILNSSCMHINMGLLMSVNGLLGLCFVGCRM